MKKAWMAGLLLFGVLGVTSVSANNYSNGYVNGDGYTWQNGYWWWGHQAYNRTLYQAPGYYQYGCYYPGQRYYQYHYSHNYQAPAPAKVLSPKDPNWRSGVVDLYKAELDHMQFQEAIKPFADKIQAAPTTPQPAVNLLGNYSGYGSSNNLHLNSAGYNNNQVYGQTYQSLVKAYGDTDTNVLFQMLDRQVAGMTGLTEKANGAFADRLGQVVDGQTKVLNTLAKGQAVHQAFRGLDTPSTTIQSSQQQFRLTPNGVVPAQPVPQPQVLPQAAPSAASQITAAWRLSASGRCVSCHSGAKLEGGFKVEDFPIMDTEGKQKVLDRISTTDTGKRMPKGGQALPFNEQLIWFQMAVQQQQETMPAAK